MPDSAGPGAASDRPSHRREDIEVTGAVSALRDANCRASGGCRQRPDHRIEPELAPHDLEGASERKWLSHSDFGYAHRPWPHFVNSVRLRSAPVGAPGCPMGQYPRGGRIERASPAQHPT